MVSGKTTQSLRLRVVCHQASFTRMLSHRLGCPWVLSWLHGNDDTNNRW